MSDKIAIYGLFDAANLCFYVGRTRDPFAREATHRHNFGERLAEFKVLKWTNEKHASKVEGQQIRKLKAIGQATENNYVNKTPGVGFAVHLNSENVDKLRVVIRRYPFQPSMVRLVNALIAGLTADQILKQLLPPGYSAKPE